MALTLRQRYALQRPLAPSPETLKLKQEILGILEHPEEKSDSMVLKEILAQEPHLTVAPKSPNCTPPQPAPLNTTELQGVGLGPINEPSDSDELLAAFAESLTNTSR